MTAAEVLRKALDGWTEEQWTRGWFALSADYTSVSPSSKLATCWCSVGRLAFASGRSRKAYHVASKALNKAIGDPYISIAGWNDRPERTFPEVRAAFERAIAIAEAEGNQ